MQSRRSVVLVRQTLGGHAITRALSTHRVPVAVQTSSTLYDYFCGQANVVVCDYAFVTDDRNRDALLSRLTHLRQATARAMMVLIVWMTTVEPALDILTWVNIECGVYLSCSVALCWTLDEIAQFMQSLSTSFTMSFDYSARAPTRSTAPLPVLIDALTQTPQMLNRIDVVRLANRHRSVADLLSSTADNLQNIPGLGAKKLARFEALLHAPFLASHQRVSDILGGERGGYGEDGTTGRWPDGRRGAVDATDNPALDAMQAALRRVYEEEDTRNKVSSSRSTGGSQTQRSTDEPVTREEANDHADEKMA